MIPSDSNSLIQILSVTITTLPGLTDKYAWSHSSYATRRLGARVHSSQQCHCQSSRCSRKENPSVFGRTSNGGSCGRSFSFIRDEAGWISPIHLGVMWFGTERRAECEYIIVASAAAAFDAPPQLTCRRIQRRRSRSC